MTGKIDVKRFHADIYGEKEAYKTHGRVEQGELFSVLLNQLSGATKDTDVADVKVDIETLKKMANLDKEKGFSYMDFIKGLLGKSAKMFMQKYGYKKRDLKEIIYTEEEWNKKLESMDINHFLPDGRILQKDKKIDMPEAVERYNNNPEPIDAEKLF